jgi:hypothetical protein
VLTVPKVLTVLVPSVPGVLTVLVLTVLVRGASAVSRQSTLSAVRSCTLSTGRHHSHLQHGPHA